MALIAAGTCNACSRPAPPPAAPVETTETAATPQTPATPARTVPPVPTASSPEPAAEPPAPQGAPPMPTPTQPNATPDPAPPARDAQPIQVVVTMLSRGKGVPTQTRAAYKQIRYLLEQQQANANVTALQASRIGLEGETRLCVEFRNREDAQSTLAEIRKLAAGVDLLNVVEEPCPSRKEDKP